MPTRMPTVSSKSSNETCVPISDQTVSSDESNSEEIIIKTSQSHSGSMLASLMKLRCNGDFCDITIMSEDFLVRAHKVILASATDYFKEMFLNETEMLESGMRHFDMPPQILKQCLEFIYSGRVEISEESVHVLLDASEKMRLPELSRLCVQFLSEKVNLQSCAQVLTLSACYNKNPLDNSIKKFLINNFNEFIKSRDFKSLEHNVVMHCLDLLEKNDADGEEQKWNSILTWTNADLETRKQHFPSLFKMLNLKCICERFLKIIIWTHELVNEFNECVGLVDEVVEASALPITLTETCNLYQFLSLKKLDGSLSGGLVANENISSTPCPMELDFNCEMDLIYFQGSIFIGTGLKIYQFSNETWTCKDVDFNRVTKCNDADKCSGCPRQPWCFGIKNHTFDMEGSTQRGGVRTIDAFSGFENGVFVNLEMSFSVKCKQKSGLTNSCYSRCIAVEDSVYMFTRNYVIEYDIKTKRMDHHNVSIGLGNGFFLVAYENCVYAIGGEGTGDRVIEFDTLTCDVIQLLDANPRCSFSFAVFKDKKLYLTDSDSLVTKCYDLRTNRLKDMLKKTERSPDGTKIAMNVSQL